MKTESNKILTTHFCPFEAAAHLLLLLRLVITHLLAAAAVYADAEGKESRCLEVKVRPASVWRG